MTITVKINETGEVKELSWYDAKTGEDIASEIIGNAGALTDGQFVRDGDTGVYSADAETYAWWDEYLTHAKADNQEKNELLNELTEKYGDEKANRIMSDATRYRVEPGDYPSHHGMYQEIFAEIRAEYL